MFVRRLGGNIFRWIVVYTSIGVRLRLSRLVEIKRRDRKVWRMRKDIKREI